MFLFTQVGRSIVPNSVQRGVPNTYSGSSGGGSNAGAIAGGVIGGFVALVLIIIGIWYFKKSRSGGADIEMYSYQQHDAGTSSASTKLKRLGSMGERTRNTQRSSYQEVNDDEDDDGVMSSGKYESKLQKDIHL